MLVPLLLLSSPHGASSHESVAPARTTSAIVVPRRASHAGAAMEHVGVHSPVPVPVTPWTTQIELADDIVDAASASTTLPPVPVVASRFVPGSTTATTAASPPPPVTTTTTGTQTAAPAAPPVAPANDETGKASWYPARAGTCASPDIAFGTVVTVVDIENGASTTCVVDDRGPKVAGRIIDLSEETFSQLTDPSVGIIEARISW